MDDREFYDRRRFERIPLTVPVKYLDVALNRESTAQTRDISAQGVGLLTTQHLPANTYLEMWLEIPNRYHPLHIMGKVVWSEEVEPNRYRVGISLDEPHFMGMAFTLENNHFPARVIPS